jgi:hypothetical protein
MRRAARAQLPGHAQFAATGAYHGIACRPARCVRACDANAPFAAWTCRANSPARPCQQAVHTAQIGASASIGLYMQPSGAAPLVGCSRQLRAPMLPPVRAAGIDMMPAWTLDQIAGLVFGVSSWVHDGTRTRPCSTDAPAPRQHRNACIYLASLAVCDVGLCAVCQVGG